MAGKSANSFGAKNWQPNSPATRYNVSGKNREFYTFENAPGLGNYATGGTIIDGGDGYIYHIFTGAGTFAVNRPSAAINSVDYLIVAGGGGSGGAGGGGGGFLFGNIGVSSTPYPIVVGAGGPDGANSPLTTGTQRNGGPSTAFGLTATGGGSGGNPGTGLDGRTGGSGGGGAFPGGAGQASSPVTIPRQGYSGANSNGPNATGGGGGAGGAGSLGVPGVSGGAGGPGRIDPNFPSSIVAKAIPSPVLPGWNPLVGPGGYAAGGAGASTPSPLQRTSPENSGYGGQTGGTSGGSGIVCIRYKKNAPYTRATGGTVEPSTHPEHPGVFRHIFTGPGTFEVTDPTLQYIDYLAVGGGGGGGGSSPPPNPGLTPGGGGGAGGFVSSIHTSTTTPTSTPEAYPWNPGYAVQVAEQYPVGPGSYPISIGAGGASGTAGSNTTVGAPGASQIIAAGGGAGAFTGNAGGNGGSGGGGATPGTPVLAGGTATPTPLIQGNAGGSAGPNTPGGAGGGGGGAGGSGGGPPTLNGGIGWYSVLSPSSYGTTGPLTPNPLYRYFAGGGGGARFFAPSLRSGGSGGGGDTNVAGTVNTGGGGGGAYAQASGGAGGSGIVIIQYPE